MDKKDKLVVIDGHNLLFQMFYGMPARIVNAEGKAIQGVLGFVGALIKIIKRTEPTHLVVLFDSEHHNERSEILEDYKANRLDYSEVPEEDSPFSQLDDVYKALDFMGIKHTEVEEYETDDVIASYAITYCKDVECVIVSWDSDYFQLINENVKVLRYRGEKTVLCDVEYIRNKFGIEPDLYADFKSLTGDKADNVKGLYKVGNKTAMSLVNEFGNLKNIIENAEKISKAFVQEAVINNTEMLNNNYKVIKLTDKATIPYDLSEIEYQYDDLKTNEVLVEIGAR